MKIKINHVFFPQNFQIRKKKILNIFPYLAFHNLYIVD